MQVVSLKTDSYEPYFDFLKAYSIICVLIGHTIPGIDNLLYGIWAGMQVPVFLLIQSFHSLKKEDAYFSFKKVMKRIFFPFFLIEIVNFFVLLDIENVSIITLCKRFIGGGGFGPGSYFPWIYLQFAVILPLVGRLIRRLPSAYLLFLSFIICEGLEVFLSMIHFPDSAYRLLCLRYLFIIYLAWGWVNKGIVINIKSIVLSLISVLAIIYFEYISVNDEPLFYSTSWSFHRWPCYYWIAAGGGIFYIFFIRTRSIFKESFVFWQNAVTKYS